MKITHRQCTDSRGTRTLKVYFGFYNGRLTGKFSHFDMVLNDIRVGKL